MRILIAAVVIALSVFSANVYADDASKKAITEELLQVMQAERMMKDINDQMRMLSEQLNPPINAPAAQSATFKKFKKRLFDIVEETVSWQAFKSDIISLYIETYTEDELQAMLTFYKSPIGRSVIEKMPKVTQQSMLIAQKRIPEMQKKLKALLEEMQQELKEEK